MLVWVSKYLWRGEDPEGVHDVPGSPHILPVIADAIELASIKTSLAVQKMIVKFEFNDVVVAVAADSDPVLIRRDYERAREGCLLGNRYVGPHPVPKLSDVEQMEDEIIRLIMKRRRADADLRRASAS